MTRTYARPVRDLRNNYKEIIALANEGNKVLITQNGRESVYVVDAKAYDEYEAVMHREYIRRALEEAEKEAADPNTVWLSWDEVKAKYAKYL